MKSCRICTTASLRTLLDFGPQPVCNRFTSGPREPEFLHPLVLGICGACGALQLVEPLSASQLLSRQGRLLYNEPEEHLDGMVAAARQTAGIEEKSAILGVSAKDASTLWRLREQGFPATVLLAPGDWGIASQAAGVETIQEKMTPETAGKIAARRGGCDLLVVRHLLEHATAPGLLAKAVKKLLKPGGHALFEVPDCARSLAFLDYTNVWEEHVTYFTPATLRRFFDLHGFHVVSLTRYPYLFQDSLVAVVRNDEEPRPISMHEPVGEGEREAAERYAASFRACGETVRRLLSGRRGKGEKIALLGAGHLGCTFINIFQASALIDFVADDNPVKHGLYMPGSRLPILPPSSLLERDVTLCLLGVSPEREGVVIEKNRRFRKKGGEFLSIFPGSPHALLPGKEEPRWN